MSARRGPGLVRRLLDLDRTAGDPPALSGRDDVDTTAVLIAELAEERDEARREVDRLTTRLARVEAERDQMFRDGQAAALALSQARRLADLWAADPRLDGLAEVLRDALDGRGVRW